MKTFTKIIRLLCIVLAVLHLQTSNAQTGILDPSDPIVMYDASTPPTVPAYGTMAKWVKTNRLNWNTSSYKSYFYKGLAFRLKFPKTYQHNVADGKTYPVFVFFHGRGEKGGIYDNEYQLYHGGELHKNAVDQGNFDGFLLYPQNQYDGWGPTQYDIINEIITKYLVPQVKADPWRVSVDGLSAGGKASWEFLIRFPKLVAASLPISNSDIKYFDSVQSYKFTPVWQFQGALDLAPKASYTKQLGAKFKSIGSNYTYTEYPGQGHGCWYSAWGEPDYFPFMTRAHKANPYTLFGRTQFCASDVINITVGVTKGYTAYEWRKDGVIIPNANSNTINATSFGIYDCRINNGGVWSPWSPIPLVISLKPGTVSPTIQLSNTQSVAFPAPDTSTGIWLQVPGNYVAYEWRKEGIDSVKGTTRFYKATTPGNYKVKVTEQYGCYSDFSTPFTIIDANGQNGPDAPTNLQAIALSKTSIQLNWSQNSAPNFNETAFEVYQSMASSSGPFSLAAVSSADATSININNLNAGTTYFYKVRAINANAASTITNIASATTLRDTSPPTPPVNLRVNSFSRTVVDLLWDASSDDVGVVAYDVYINGIKSFTTTNTGYTVYNLTPDKTYNFTIKARDFANNSSITSNQVSATTYLRGLTYKFYQGSWSVLPDFNLLAPISSGTISNINISNSTESDDFGFLFQGSIKIPVTGSYTFRLNSDDGSKLYIGSPYTFSSTALIDNDGLHGPQNVDGTITLNAGIYPISVAFFQLGGGANCDLYWKTPQTGGNFTAVPDSVFTDGFVVPGSAPVAPSTLIANAISAKKINLTWTDNSNNETGFEISRATNSVGPFYKIALTPANTTTYTDSLLNPQTVYYYKVKAIGRYGESTFNDGATAALSYTFYKGSFTQLPDFSTLLPVSSGTINNFDISASLGLDFFAYKFEGVINIQANDTYTFYTSSDDGSQLFIDDKLVVDNDGLHGTSERSGSIALTAGIHFIRVTFFERTGGEALSVKYSSATIAKQTIPDVLLKSTPVNDTTFALPGAPNSPSNLIANAISPSKINLSWTDNGNNENAFNIFRSSPDNSNYQLLATVPFNVTNYVDSNLKGNTSYYYQVRSANESGTSGFSNESFATTINNTPVISAIANKSMAFGTTLQLNVAATDIDNEQLDVVINNLPAFASFTSIDNGKGIISFYPQDVDQGVYNNISVTISDQHGGSVSTSFNLVVNSNHNPSIVLASNLIVNEGSTSTASIAASDADASDVLTWDLQNVPSFVTPTINGGTVNFAIQPGYADNGAYTITANISDGNGGTDSKTFTIIVNDVNPNQKIYLNFNTNNAVGVSGPWNNLNKNPAANLVIKPFTDATGAITTAGLQVLSSWQTVSATATGATGATTGNNSGVYPDSVSKTFWYSNTATQTYKLTGLDTAYNYNLTFFGSRGGVTDNRTSVYTVNGINSVSLNAAGNTKNTVTIAKVKPNTDSSFSITQATGTGAVFSYINAMVIEKIYDNFQAPAAPKSFTISLQSGVPNLIWKDVAFNENGYEVYRSINAGGPFQLVSPTAPANTTIYADTSSALMANATYYYQVRCVNAFGASNYTDVLSITLPNKAPVLAAISNQTVKADSIAIINLAATDDLGDVVSLSVSGLPSFATFTNNGNGNGSIKIAPSILQKGIYTNISVSATDNLGAITVRSFSITVIDGGLSNVYINFNDGTTASPPQATPWNNINGTPIAGRSVSNLVDDAGNNTGASITLVDAWSASAALGAVTGNNSGVYPDNVLKSLFYVSTANTVRIRLNNLSLTKKYNLVFFASRTSVTDNRTTNYTVNGQTVSLNAAGNVANTTSLNGLTADVNGQIEISIARGTGSSFAYLNAMVVQSYIDNGKPLSPANLTATSKIRTAIQLNWIDKSTNETGFEIWRAPSANGNYTFLKTLAANTTSYMDGSLNSGAIFFYKVRASGANNQNSGYSNIAGASTAMYGVNINFNDGSTTGPAAAYPWNNTNSIPFIGYSLPNLLNDINENSGINITSLSNFGGINNSGMNTGNNSGVAPDNVLRSSWFLDAADTGRFKIDGLNLTHVYSFTFIASRQGTGIRTTIYNINNQTVSLNAMSNISNSVSINNIIPDSTGSIYIKIYSAQGSAFAYINGLTIQASPSTDSTLNYNNLKRAKKKNILLVSNSSDAIASNNLNEGIKSYPNPLFDDVTLKLVLNKNVDKFLVTVTDMNGKKVYSRAFYNALKGIWQHSLGLNGQVLNSGIYMIQVSGIPGQKPEVIKVMKQ